MASSMPPLHVEHGERPAAPTPGVLRALVVEDEPDDAELLLLELARSGYRVLHRRVDTAEAMRAALEREDWDVVISDYAMPRFSAPAAIEVLKQSGKDLPFIIVSGTIGEDTAVEALKAGAHDFLVKGRLARLTPAIERERREASIRRERREALSLVQASERRLSALFNQVAVGILQTDLAGRILSANQRFCDIVGRSQEALVGCSTLELTHPEDRARAAEVDGRLRRGEGSFVLEKRYCRPGGACVWVSSTMSLVTDEHGAPSYAVSIVQDITDRKRAEAELRLAIHARDEFLSIASHELKTPLTALELSVQSGARLLGGAFEPARLASKLEMASRQVHRLTALINNLLDVTRITAGRLQLERRTQDLREIVDRALAAVQPALAMSPSRLEVRVPARLVGLWDPLALETVLVNLLSNAVKFGEGKPIELSAEASDGVLRVVVVDHGIGIAPGEQERIFQRFERAVPAEHYGGFGIGLWIARQLVEAHGGTVRVASTKGQGSTFVVELPLAPRTPDPPLSGA